MSKAAELKKQIQILAGTYDKDLISFELAIIDSVDTTAWTCTATPVSGISDTPISDIQLSAELSSNGFILVPTVGSTVILAITLRNDIYVVMASEVDQLIFYRDNNNGTFQSFVINGNGITMGDGSFGGLVKIIDPSNVNAGILKKLNNLENRVNQLQADYNGHLHTGVTPGSGSSGPVTIPVTGAALTPTVRSDIENTDITHGIPLT